MLSKTIAEKKPYLVRYNDRVVPIFSSPDEISDDVEELAEKKLSVVFNYELCYIFSDETSEDSNYKRLIVVWEGDIDQSISDWIHIYAKNRMEAIKKEEIILIEIKKDMFDDDEDGDIINKETIGTKKRKLEEINDIQKEMNAEKKRKINKIIL